MESPIVKSIEQQLPNLSQAEILGLAARLIALAQERVKSPAESDLSKYSGILKPDVNPLQFQKQIRAEWDRE